MVESNAPEKDAQQPSADPANLVIRPARPWLAPAIALGIAMIVLLILLIPGVLRFPESATVVLNDDDDRVAWQREINRALETQVAELRDAVNDGVCRADDGRYYPVTPELLENGPEGLEPIHAIPPSAESLQPSSSAVRPDSVFNGNLRDLLDQGTVAVIRRGSGGSGFGTGFFVGDRYVMTNAHVAGDAASEYYVLNEKLQRPVKATLRATSGQTGIGGPDFALLEVSEPVEGIEAFAFAAPQRMERVNAVGYPAFYLEEEIVAVLSGSAVEIPPPAITDGQIVTLRAGQGVQLVPHTATISQGNSGGPLVDLCGRVLGVNTYGTQQETGGLSMRSNYALSAIDAAAFLTQNNVTPIMAQGPCGPAAAAAQGEGEETDQSPESQLPQNSESEQ